MPDFNMENMTPDQMKKMREQMEAREYANLSPEEAAERKRQKELQKKNNIAILDETLDLCHKGSYEKDGKTVRLGYEEEKLSAIRVFLPDEIALMDTAAAAGIGTDGCACSCENRDALSLACEKSREYGDVLVMSLASSVRPGGAVRDGASAQEEDLCRKSSLLLSLESKAAKSYYDYNNSLHTHLGSDAVMISPDVVVIRDGNGALLKEPFKISVISCAAPNIRFGFEGKSEEEYKKMLQKRLEGMLCCAFSMGYRNLILGAFGCGIFGNDAAVVSDAFLEAFKAFREIPFSHVDFAVLCRDGKDYNYREFCRNFDGKVLNFGTPHSRDLSRE